MFHDNTMIKISARKTPGRFQIVYCYKTSLVIIIGAKVFMNSVEILNFLSGSPHFFFFPLINVRYNTRYKTGAVA